MMGKSKALIPALAVVIFVGSIETVIWGFSKISETLDIPVPNLDSVLQISGKVILGSSIILLVAILFGLIWLLPKIRGLLPPLLSLFVLALVIDLIIRVVWSVSDGKVEWGLLASIVTFTVVFGLPWLLPALWRGIERVWWSLSLGRSGGAQRVAEYALNDFKLSIRQKVTDEGLQGPIPALLALNARLVEFRHLHCNLERMKVEAEKRLFPTSINELNEGWRSGVPPRILKEYMEDIQKTSGSIKDVRKRLRGRCAVANVKYLSGELKEANELATQNWTEAGNNSLLKWMASYAYFGSKSLFAGEFEPAMEEMADHWMSDYEGTGTSEEKEKTRKERERITDELSRETLANPVISIPRQLILAAAFNGSPKAAAFSGKAKDKKYWPGKAQKWPDEVFDQLIQPDEPKSEWRWVQLWYDEARRICADEISLGFSHAYAGFYFTLLYLHSQDVRIKRFWRRKAERALDSIVEKDSPTVLRYSKSGFYGIYKFVTEKDPGKALEYLRRAGEYSAISGNRFAAIDCLFMCCRAVAAQEAGRHLEPEVDYYLKEARKVAKKTGRTFYSGLCDAAHSTVSKLRVDEARASRYWDSAKKKIVQDKKLDQKDQEKKKRVLLIFAPGNHVKTTNPKEPSIDVMKKAKIAGKYLIGKLTTAIGKLTTAIKKKDEDKEKVRAAIKNLNEGLRIGMPPEILKEYRKTIDDYTKTIDENRSNDDVNDLLKLYGQCAVANMKYLQGDLKQAHKLAEKNWKDAKKLEESKKQKAKNGSIPEWQVDVPRWAASYAYFNTRALFLGEFEEAVEGMAERWNEHCARKDRKKREAEIDRLSDKENLLTVNPVLSLPRHLILAAAFNGSPIAAAFEGSPKERENYWPREARDLEGKLRSEFAALERDELESERKWVECWHKEAVNICVGYKAWAPSLVFSHAYAGFYFTLLYLDSRDKGMTELQKKSRKRAKKAFEAVEINEESPIVSRYAYSGFHGIFKLVTEENPEEALKCLREAARYSDISGNRFASVDCLFMCCHAVAAQRAEQRAEREQRVKRNLKPEVDDYLEEAEKVAKKLGYGFYYDLCEAARSEVSKMRGRTGRAERHDARTRVGQAGKRILLILRTDPANTSARPSA